jgi:hypothetical protein
VNTEARQPTDAERPSRARRNALLAGGAGLAALAIALPVGGAFAAGDGSGGSSGNSGGNAPSQTQEGRPPEGAPGPQGMPDRPCPEDNGGGQGQGSDSYGTEQPAPSFAL